MEKHRRPEYSPQPATSDELAGYRPVSGLAVAALMTGCGSALVLFTSLAAMLPLVAIVLAIVALVDLRRSEGRRVGRLAALAGLALAIGFTAQAASASFVERWIASQRAEATAAAWIEAIAEDRIDDAVSLSSPAALPMTSRDFSATEQTSAERAVAFRGLPVVEAVAACPRGQQPQLTVSRDASDGSVWIVRARLAGCDRAMTLRVEPRSAKSQQGAIERWLVTGFSLAD